MNNLTVATDNILMENYKNTDNITNDIKTIIDTAQRQAYQNVDKILVQRNWIIGYRISQEELKGEERADYGMKIINMLSEELSKSGKKGFDKSSLYSYVRFYKYFPRIVDSLSPQSENLLSWTHYRALIRVHDDKARGWYAKEALEQMWSVRELQRHIQSQYYQRIVKTQYEELVKNTSAGIEMSDADRLEYVRNPVIAEFLGLETHTEVNEAELETAILDNLQKFLMELGKGYAFVARQQHIKTEQEDYYIDLVFYNYYMKCFVLIDLKTKKITHQDVGQMDMYVRMYDELKKVDGDNPTLGIVLCAETDEDIAKYSVLNGNEQLFASKYKLYMPSEEELQREIETQKRFFELQQQEKAALKEAAEQ
ncbi:MAG: PDDEXK nuclease domain-containing protein [Roseburia sp.]|nr:PDDEXK nuclease domain-containing protein [Roseburia sp.]